MKVVLFVQDDDWALGAARGSLHALRRSMHPLQGALRTRLHLGHSSRPTGREV